MAGMNPFEIAQRQLDEAAERLGLDRSTQEMLRQPQRELHVTIPVRMDNGSIRVRDLGVRKCRPVCGAAHSELLGGGRLVAVTDSSSGVHNDAGLDPEKLVAHKLKTGSLKGFTGSKPISNKDLLELDIDVLYPHGVHVRSHSTKSLLSFRFARPEGYGVE